MLKQMQRRFIIAVMSAFAAVMLILIVGINVMNSYQMERSQDKKIASIFEYNEMVRNMPREDKPPIYEMSWAGGEDAEFTTRFFIVQCDEKGNINVFGNEYISSIDEETAQLYTKAVLDERKNSGYYEDYRYSVRKDKNELTLVFLNVADAEQFRQNLLLVSVLIGLGSLIVLFILVIVFARPATKPYMRTIERQKRFITDASHELKTPITSIATSADIAAMEYENDEWISNIQQQTVRLSRLVNDLVTLSRLDEEMPFPEKTEFSLSEAAWEIMEPFAAMAEARDKNFYYKIEENILFYGERNAIQQMLSILLDNAVKYSNENGEIRFSIFRNKGKIVIELYNTCDMQDKMELERLFDRFYRPDESRSINTGGSGIGLSIAQMVAVTHGGKISVRNVKNQALLFKVIF